MAVLQTGVRRHREGVGTDPLSGLRRMGDNNVEKAGTGRRPSQAGAQTVGAAQCVTLEALDGYDRAAGSQ